MKLSLRLVPLACLLTFPAAAATLTVGPGHAYALPSQAIRAAAPGDTIRIAPGHYVDCAVWSTNDLTIEGMGAGPVIGGKICQRKGVFVITAPDATIRNVTLAGATSRYGNGSGIRDNGLKLVVEHSTFRDNQDGILMGDNKAATLIVRDSTFTGNGACLPHQGCAHGIYAGHLGLARIENSHFFDTKIGHHIKSRALHTEIVGNTIEDGPHGTSSYLIDVPNGGTVLITRNTMEKGPNTDNPTRAISLGEEGHLQPSSGITISDNTFTDNGPPTVFVNNQTKTPARLTGNVFKGNRVRPLWGPGTVKK